MLLLQEKGHTTKEVGEETHHEGGGWPPNPKIWGGGGGGGGFLIGARIRFSLCQLMNISAAFVFVFAGEI